MIFLDFSDFSAERTHWDGSINFDVSCTNSNHVTFIAIVNGITAVSINARTPHVSMQVRTSCY